jgi:2-alkyl-3-oxoalkanoate reductase
MHLLVTGAAGFLGRAVVDAAVAHGHHVTAIVRTRRGTPPAGVSEIVTDLARPDALAPHLAGVDAVIHCAASLDGDAATQRRDTIEATEQVVTSMSRAGARRIVLASSFAVYDFARLRAGDQLDEWSALAVNGADRGPYIDAKLAQEATVRNAARDLDWRILRPGLVFGPGRTWFYDLGLQAHPRWWITLAGEAELPLTFVGNCADAFVAAAESPTGRIVANIVDDELPTRRHYARAVAAASKPPPFVSGLSWAALSLAARAANLVGVTAGMLHPERLAARCLPLRYSNAVAKDAWGWRPTVPIPDAVARSLL